MRQVQLLLSQIKRDPDCKWWELYLSTQVGIVSLDGQINSSFVYSEERLHYIACALYDRDLGVFRQIVSSEELLSDKIDRNINIQALLGIIVLGILLLCQSIWALVSHNGRGDQRVPELNPSYIKDASVLVHLGRYGQEYYWFIKDRFTDLCSREQSVIWSKDQMESHSTAVFFKSYLLATSFIRREQSFGGSPLTTELSL